MEVDFTKYQSILSGLISLFKIPQVSSQSMPAPVVLASELRPGLSPSLIASRIIERQSEAGIPVGALPSGKPSPDEIMEKIRIEEIIQALTSEAKIDVAIRPGTTLQATGGNAGGPIQVFGTTLGIATGNATIL